jgi:hypothetical protein
MTARQASLIRLVRAALVIGLVWSLAWLPIGIAVALSAASAPPQPGDLLHRPVEFRAFLTVWTLWGGISGVGFALILSLRERRRTLKDLSPGRTAFWGALGAMSAPTSLTALDMLRGQATSPLYDWRIPLVSILASAALGAACAAGTLLVARRSPG